MDFNHWDIILFLPLLYAAWKGFRKGLIVELASILALIAGLYIAANFSEFTAQKLGEFLNWNGAWVGYASFLITFIAVVFGIYALAKVVEKAVNMAALKFVNKLTGLFFGVLKIALILSIIINLIGYIDQHIPVLSKSEPEKSLLFEPVKNLAPTVIPVLLNTEWMAKTEDLLAPLFDDPVTPQ
ncbi:MAG: CvpA family protein [Salibacteraceae bacterium]